MITTKIRLAAVVFLAALSIGSVTESVLPTSAEAAIKSRPTGDVNLDRYCGELSDLVNAALDKEKAALAAGDTKTAAAWRSYANSLLAAGRVRGCDWYAARLLGRLGVPHDAIHVRP